MNNIKIFIKKHLGKIILGTIVFVMTLGVVQLYKHFRNK